ncbi:MAG: hypothetical protein ACJA1Z_001651 [Patiriisocius sp.]|jgi:hypothetical protein
MGVTLFNLLGQKLMNVKGKGAILKIGFTKQAVGTYFVR